MPKSAKLKSAIDGFTQALGADGVSTDEARRRLFSQDVYHSGEIADFVLSPKDTEGLSRAASIAAREGIALNPRGGGMSYTKGYTPDRAGIGILDFSGMDKILEINGEDMFVTVQAGATWKQLYEALEPLGLRTPFWGPLSGILSTIGGGMSQNNAFFGGGKYGASSESVLSLKVVTADGRIIDTGSAASTNGKPFFRHYGPDMAGLFLGDGGALGYKAEITLRLIPKPPHFACASFDFKSADGFTKALAGIYRTGLACEAFGFDPNLQRVRMQRASLAADVGALKNVVTKQGGLLKGLKAGAKLAMAGRGYMDDVAYSMHVTTEGHSAQGVKDELEILRKLALENGGTEIENSIPKIIRANPFGPLNNMVGPKGERWVPIHGIVANSDGPACYAELDDWFAQSADLIEQHEILVGYLCCGVGNTGYLIEPVFIWPDELFEVHKQNIESSHLKKLPLFAANPAAAKAVETLRQGVLEIFEKYGAAHFQVGRTYRYAQQNTPQALGLVKAVKAYMDPKGQINPGSLGLNAHKD